MKKLTFILLIAALFVACSPEKKSKEMSGDFTLQGTVEGRTYGTVSLEVYENGDFEEKFAGEIVGGNFKLRGELESPAMYYLKIKEYEDVVPVFLEPAAMEITLEIDSSGNIESELSGSKAHADYQALSEQYSSFDETDREIYNVYYKSGQEQENQEYLDIADSLWENNRLARIDFLVSKMKEDPDNIASAYMINRNSYLLELDDLGEIVNSIDASIQASQDVKKLNDRLAVLKRVDIGQPIVDFTMEDTAGNPVKLSAQTGKDYLLVDFWASWCAPCRQENPNIVAIYQDYKDKGFSVFGVSLDKDRDKWIKAIHDDNLSWDHVSDLVGWQNKAAQLYGVRSIPHSVLVDPEGIIIARNLRGEELREKVAELLD
ncbi:MAG: TlpA disulfide reductase family protein [Bacteroidota bacterium]|nr:TlpA disulfide reductase family protein [Bacteroidota bacterium]